MLSVLELDDNEKILDLGCGYGFIGVYLNKTCNQQNIVCSDIDKIAIEYTKENVKINNTKSISIILSEGFRNIKEKDFSIILSNPPYHTDFSVAKHFIEKGFNHLQMEGKMYMVTKRKLWYKKKLISIFGGVKIHEVDDYYIFISQKRSEYYKREN